MISSLRPEISTGEGNTNVFEKQHSGSSLWAGDTVGDAAIAKGSLNGMTMGKPQGGKGHVVTLEQTDTNMVCHLGGH